MLDSTAIRAWMRRTPARTDDYSDTCDAVLAAAARADHREFEAIYRTYVDRIYRYCHARLRRRELAEDATSQTFMKALAAIDTFREGSLAAWLFTIARNASIDILRSAERRHLGDAALQAIEDPGAGPESYALVASSSAALRSAMDGLSNDQRAAVELQLAGWSLAESAEALGRSVSAVKMPRARALSRLRTKLAPIVGEGGQR